MDPVLWSEELCEAKEKGKGKLSFHSCGDDDTAELALRTITSVNQLSIYGAVADMCDELACRISGCSESTWELVAQNNSETMVMPTELLTTNKTPRTNDKVQGYLLHDYEKIANLPDHLRLPNCASNVGITMTVANSISRPSTMRNWTNWRAHVEKINTSLRDKVKGWIRGNTKVGPALEVPVCHHQGRYGIEIMINSFLAMELVPW